MVDVPGNTTTNVSVTLGSTTSGTLEVNGDHDWYRITLSAGQSVSVTLNGLTLIDPFLYIRNSSGGLLYSNDDISSTDRDSQVAFSAPSSGTYYIDVGAWNEQFTGNYQLLVQNYSAPPLYTNDQIANQLVSGYWGGDVHHFNVGQGGTITVNITALTAAGQTLARAALAQWADIIGVRFQEVSVGGQITFDDTEDGAFADGNWSRGITSTAHVNVSTAWISDYGTGLNSYSFQTYVHEVGHALGLGHAGNYNETAQYPYDALFQNDAWSTSVMSYFSQRDNTYFAGQGFTEDFVVTPMVADIVAMQTLYGLSTTTRTGDTTYGFNSNAGRDVFNANLNPGVAYTIFDSGGTDTLDYSGFASSQLINLNPETFSNVGPGVGNVSIARGVSIENAIGGSGNDRLIGNGADNVLSGRGGADTINGSSGDDTLSGGVGVDSLSGGAGTDLFQDTSAGLTGDRITDLSAADHIQVTNLTATTANVQFSAGLLSFNGGSVTLDGRTSGRLFVKDLPGGGVDIRLDHVATNDFNGDGRSDVLLRQDSGWVTNWLGQSNGSFSANSAALNLVHWQVAATGNFNADGRTDIILRHDDGWITQWLGQSNGSFVSNGAVSSYWIHPDWNVAGTGDFNGDGRDDLLLRHDNGSLTEWLGQANGSFSDNGAAASRWIHPDWKVVGTGDFNGDGCDDMLLRDGDGWVTEWLGQANGSFVDNGATASRWIHPAWKFAGTGDFNGDGIDDVLLRHDDGWLGEWLGRGDGTFADNSAVANKWIQPDWQVTEVGDFNGDGIDDMLLRHAIDGATTDWLGHENGAFSSNSGVANYVVDTSWHVVPSLLALT